MTCLGYIPVLTSRTLMLRWSIRHRLPVGALHAHARASTQEPEAADGLVGTHPTVPHLARQTRWHIQRTGMRQFPPRTQNSRYETEQVR